MADGVIYLVQPLYGSRILVGSAVIGPTWVEYTFSPDQLAAMREDRDSSDEIPVGQYVLIPLTNVRAIAVAEESEGPSRERSTPEVPVAAAKGGNGTESYIV